MLPLFLSEKTHNAVRHFSCENNETKACLTILIFNPYPAE